MKNVHRRISFSVSPGRQAARELQVKTFALALGAGGARGLAHIAIVEALDEMGVAPAAIAGSSIGAFHAAALRGILVPGPRLRDGERSAGERRDRCAADRSRRDQLPGPPVVACPRVGLLPLLRQPVEQPDEENARPARWVRTNQASPTSVIATDT